MLVRKMGPEYFRENHLHYMERIFSFHTDVARVVLEDSKYNELMGKLTIVSTAFRECGQYESLVVVTEYLDKYLQKILGDSRWEEMNNMIREIRTAWFTNPGTKMSVMKNQIRNARKKWFRYLLTLG